MPTSDPIDFVLSDLSGLFTLTDTASILGTIPTDLDNDLPAAMFNVRTIDMREVFQFKIDEMNIGGTDTSNVSIGEDTDVRYYVNLLNWPSDLIVNPSQAVMRDFSNTFVSSGDTVTETYNSITYSLTSVNPAFNIIEDAESNLKGQIPNNQLMIKHDFLRHIAKETFGSSQAVDLFRNESSMKRNISKLGAGFFDSSKNFVSGTTGDLNFAAADISAGLYRKLQVAAEGSDGTNLVLATDGMDDDNTTTGRGFYIGRVNDYDTNSDGSRIENYSRELLKQIAAKAPERFQSSTTVKVNDTSSANYSLLNTSDPQSIPFQDGDSIQLMLTINPSSTQYKNPKSLALNEANNNISGDTDATITDTDTVPARQYRIILRLVSDSNLRNIQPIDENSVNPSSSSSNIQFDSSWHNPNPSLLNYQFPYYLSFGRSPPAGFTGELTVTLDGNNNTVHFAQTYNTSSTTSENITNTTLETIDGTIVDHNVKHFPLYKRNVKMNTEDTSSNITTDSDLNHTYKQFNYKHDTTGFSTIHRTDLSTWTPSAPFISDATTDYYSVSATTGQTDDNKVTVKHSFDYVTGAYLNSIPSITLYSADSDIPIASSTYDHNLTSGGGSGSPDEINYVYAHKELDDTEDDGAGNSIKYKTQYKVDYNSKYVRPLRLIDENGNFVRYILKNTDGYFDGKYVNKKANDLAD